MSVGDFIQSARREDAGSRTADLYDWQAAMAAADGLAQLVAERSVDAAPPTESSIICEHHEDYACLVGPAIELVSVKHREKSQGAWTWATIANDGGLIHLYERWRTFGGGYRCRLVTNAGLKTGDVAALGRTCANLASGVADLEEHKELTESTTKKLCIALLKSADEAELPQDWRATPPITANTDVPAALSESVRAFMCSLVIDVSRPHRDDIGDAAPSKYAEPAIAILGISLSAKAGWTAVLDLFRVRMRARGQVSEGGLSELITMALRTPPGAARERALRRRTVATGDIEAALRHAAARPGAYNPPAPSSALTTLALKLRSGGCSTTTIKVAEDHAGEWRTLRRVKSAEIPGTTAHFARAERKLKTIASVAADEALSHAPRDEPYGREMWRLLSERAKASELPYLPLDGDDSLALGAICDLASRCVIWFGPEFDVDALRRELQGNGEAAS